MNDDYKRLRQEAEKLFFRFKDRVDDRNAGSGIEHQVRDLVEQFEMNKPPRSIEEKIKQLQNELRRLDNAASPVMDAADLDDFVDRYEDLRMELRELDNY